MCKTTNFWTLDIVKFLQTVAIFTDDDYEIWNLICRGLTNKEISKELKVSPSTVSRRIQHLRDKYDQLSAQYPDRLPKRKDMKK